MKANVTVSAKLGNYETTTSVEIGTEDYIREQIFEVLKNENPEIEEDDQADENSITYEVTNWEDLDDYKSLQDPELFEELADLEEEDFEMVDAAIYCGISVNNIQEAYNGHFRDDEEFAQDMAEQLGETPKDNHWPHYCIDWEFAARELMMDYCEERGYYFRNL